MNVLTSDLRDYMGDDWQGEKDFFHEQAVRVPMLVYGPRPEADGTRNMPRDALVEAVDMAATFVEPTGAEVPDHFLQGRSRMGRLHGRAPE